VIQRLPHLSARLPAIVGHNYGKQAARGELWRMHPLFLMPGDLSAAGDDHPSPRAGRVILRAREAR